MLEKKNVKNKKKKNIYGGPVRLLLKRVNLRIQFLCSMTTFERNSTCHLSIYTYTSLMYSLGIPEEEIEGL